MDRVPTANFDPGKGSVVLTNATLLPIQKNIYDMLLTHVLIQYVFFTLDDFISLNKSPQKSFFNSVKIQFDRLVTPKINQKIDFQFSESSFYDPDRDKLTFSVSKPAFLDFSPDTLRFTGTPSKNDNGTHVIIVSVSDGYNSISDKISFTIINKPPHKI